MQLSSLLGVVRRTLDLSILHPNPVETLRLSTPWHNGALHPLKKNPSPFKSFLQRLNGVSCSWKIQLPFFTLNYLKIVSPLRSQCHSPLNKIHYHRLINLCLWFPLCLWIPDTEFFIFVFFGFFGGNNKVLNLYEWCIKKRRRIKRWLKLR